MGHMWPPGSTWPDEFLNQWYKFRVSGLGFRGLGLRVLGFRVEGLGVHIGFRAEGFT